jgi:hypothetical protein
MPGVTKKVEPRYIDGARLMELLARRFPGQTFEASVSETPVSQAGRPKFLEQASGHRAGRKAVGYE